MPLTDDNEYDYSHENKPKCPHCDAELDVHHELDDEFFEEGEVSINCRSCEKDYKCQVDVHVSYSTWNQD